MRINRRKEKGVNKRMGQAASQKKIDTKRKTDKPEENIPHCPNQTEIRAIVNYYSLLAKIKRRLVKKLEHCSMLFQRKINIIIIFLMTWQSIPTNMPRGLLRKKR